MILGSKKLILLCGLLLMLAAFPVFAQNSDVNGVMINKRPLMDFANLVIDSVHTKKVDLDAPFTLVMSAELAKGQDGQMIILANPQLLQGDGDPGMRKLVHDGIIAIGDSGWFGYLALFEGVKKVKITVSQDGSTFKASITAETKTDLLARQTASGLNTFLSIGKLQLTKPDEKVFFENAMVSSAGKTFTIGFVLSKEFVKQKMNESLEREKENSTAKIGVWIKPGLTAWPKMV